ncbi:hypothetical protein LINPERPRIM_LOCUS1172 [Linum perenne]
MVITGRQRYENGWCFWSEINKKGELREMKINFGERGGLPLLRRRNGKLKKKKKAEAIRGELL